MLLEEICTISSIVLTKLGEVVIFVVTTDTEVL